MTKPRNELIDFLKGYAILLVVLGHCIQRTLPQSFDVHPLFRVIYSFHMPLFMFLSGYVAYFSFSGKTQQLLSRMQTLMIPFFSWFILFFFMYYANVSFDLFFEKLVELLKNPDRGLWFLWTLSFNYLLLFISLRISKNHTLIPMLIFFLMINVINIFVHPVAGMASLGWHLLFFSAGYGLKKFDLDKKKAFVITGHISLIIFPVLVIFWNRSSSVQLSILIKNGNGWMSLLKYFYGLIVPFSGILFSFAIAQWILQMSFIKNLFSYLGRISLEIYYTHSFFFSLIFLIASWNINLQIIVCFIIITALSVLTQYLIKQNRYFAFIFYGKSIKKIEHL
jgi:fucose 4-O-acetylase-like acetyltransferase